MVLDVVSKDKTERVELNGNQSVIMAHAEWSLRNGSDGFKKTRDGRKTFNRYEIDSRIFEGWKPVLKEVSALDPDSIESIKSDLLKELPWTIGSGGAAMIIANHHKDKAQHYMSENLSKGNALEYIKGKVTSMDKLADIAISGNLEAAKEIKKEAQDLLEKLNGNEGFSNVKTRDSHNLQIMCEIKLYGNETGEKQALDFAKKHLNELGVTQPNLLSDQLIKKAPAQKVDRGNDMGFGY